MRGAQLCLLLHCLFPIAISTKSCLCHCLNWDCFIKIVSRIYCDGFDSTSLTYKLKKKNRIDPGTYFERSLYFIITIFE